MRGATAAMVSLCLIALACGSDRGAMQAASPASARSCGQAICPEGTICCNASCGICTAPNEYCTQQQCSSPQCGMLADCGAGYLWSPSKCACVRYLAPGGPEEETLRMKAPEPAAHSPTSSVGP